MSIFSVHLDTYLYIKLMWYTSCCCIYFCVCVLSVCVAFLPLTHWGGGVLVQERGLPLQERHPQIPPRWRDICLEVEKEKTSRR